VTKVATLSRADDGYVARRYEENLLDPPHPVRAAARCCAATQSHAQVSREAAAEVERVTGSSAYKAAMAAPGGEAASFPLFRIAIP
jgi:hypothetical protein